MYILLILFNNIILKETHLIMEAAETNVDNIAVVKRDSPPVIKLLMTQLPNRNP